jgi:cytochrome c peroxidase
MVPLLGIIGIGCSENPVPSAPAGGVTAAPSLASGNVPVGVLVDTAVTCDASRAGATFVSSGPGPLSYRITFENPNGFTAVGATIAGRPAAAGITWATVVATDALGHSASDRFAVVAFALELATPTRPVVPFRYTDAANPLPAHFVTPINGVSVVATDNTPLDNPISDPGAALGRVLFYDVRVSANDELSCAGCHSPFIAFADTPPLSFGFAGGLTGRHTPALTNARFYQRGRFFWDERAATLEEQVLGPIQSPVEMGVSLENLVAKVTATSYYPPLFQAAFGSATVTSERHARALAQYVRSLVSTNAKYDRALAGTATLTAQEQQGEALFRSSGCTSCHTTVSQVSDSVHNIGLDAVDTDAGAGRARSRPRRCATLPCAHHTCTMAASRRSSRWWSSSTPACSRTRTSTRGSATRTARPCASASPAHSERRSSRS